MEFKVVKVRRNVFVGLHVGDSADLSNDNPEKNSTENKGHIAKAGLLLKQVFG